MNDWKNLEKEYASRYNTLLKPLAEKLEIHIKDNFQKIERIDRITSRPKSIDRFIEKSQKIENDKLKYSNPLSQIQDQLGARIITFYLEDVPRLSKVVEDYYRKIESVDIVPDSESEFGYFGKHFILILPEDILSGNIDRDKIPKFFELQIKTLFQHARSEANHDLGYKPNHKLSSDEKRKIAFTSAQAWGADQIFNELHLVVNRNNN